MDLEKIRFAPKIVISAMGALVVLAVFELLAVFGYHESPADRNAFGYSRDAGFSVANSFVKIATTASRRLWRQTYPANKPAGLKRIIFVGDSVARGRSLERSVTEVLRRELEERYAIRAEVWNLSSPGYGSRRKEVVISKAMEFQPDLIIYHAGFSTEYEDSREWERYQEYHSWHPRHWVDQLPFLGRVKLSKTEQLYWRLPEEVRATSLDDSLASRIAAIASKSDAKYWIPSMLTNLDRTVSVLHEHGIPMIILTRSSLGGSGAEVSDGGLDSEISARYGSRPWLMIVSGRKLFSGRHDVRQLFSDGSHWTEQGTKLVAEELGKGVCNLLSTNCGNKG